MYILITVLLTRSFFRDVLSRCPIVFSQSVGVYTRGRSLQSRRRVTDEIRSLDGGARDPRLDARSTGDALETMGIARDTARAGFLFRTEKGRKLMYGLITPTRLIHGDKSPGGGQGDSKWTNNLAGEIDLWRKRLRGFP